jgi:exopolysaccharide biosynthesis polyprenyl glycosylphosphotransferase
MVLHHAVQRGLMGRRTDARTSEARTDLGGLDPVPGAQRPPPSSPDGTAAATAGRSDDRSTQAVASAGTLDDAPQRRWVTRALMGDLVAALLASAVARTVRFGVDDATLAAESRMISYTLLGLGIAVIWPVSNALSGAYEPRVSLFGVEEIRRILRSAFGLLTLLAVLHFVFRMNLARGYVGILLPSLIGFTVIWRMVLRSRTGSERSAGIGRHRTVAIGPVEDLVRVVLQLRSRAGSAIDVVALVVDDLDEHEPVPEPLASLPRLASRDQIRELAGEGPGFDLLLRAGQPPGPEIWALARRAHEAGVAMAIAPSRTDAHNVNLSYLPLGTTPLLMVETPSLKPAQAIAKAVFDRVTATLLLVVAAPLLAVISVAIRVLDGRPVLFRQERAGQEGRPFTCLKFRTMVPEAEDLLAGLQDDNEAEGLLFKVREDPRVTRVGRFLRRTSLDELPQLVNVVKGDMSLVGPRPWPVAGDEVSSYDERTARRLLVKPGITGLWQVSGRSDLPWDDAVYLDLLYVDHWSPLLDLVILARTVITVLRPRGAY